jgi:adenylate kinase family enzyme
VRRVSVVGVSGAGKSTLGREVAARLGVPFAELDALFHQPGWEPLPADEFRHRVSDLASAGGWVIDGNYHAILPLVWARADTVIWLDLPRPLVMRRIVWRTIRRLVARQVLWNGNRERWRNLITWDEQESVIAWAWRHYPVYQQRYAAAAADPALRHLTFIRIASRADLRQFRESLR